MNTALLTVPNIAIIGMFTVLALLVAGFVGRKVGAISDA